MRMTSSEPRGHTHRAPSIPDASQLWCFHKGNYVGVYGSYRQLSCACIRNALIHGCVRADVRVVVGDNQFSHLDDVKFSRHAKADALMRISLNEVFKKIRPTNIEGK